MNEKTLIELVTIAEGVLAELAKRRQDADGEGAGITEGEVIAAIQDVQHACLVALGED